MPRALKVCAHPGCTALVNGTRCPEHAPKPWARSADAPRRSNLSGSAQQARARRVITRDGTICHVCGIAGANQADHVIPVAEGGADDESNMRAIHGIPCHAEKSAAESARARSRTMDY